MLLTSILEIFESQIITNPLSDNSDLINGDNKVDVINSKVNKSKFIKKKN